MKKQMIVGGGVAVLAAAAAFGGMAIAGGDDSRDLERTVVAEQIVAKKAGPVVRGGGGTGRVIQTFYLQDKSIPDEGDDPVFGPTCPDNAGNAIDAGAATDQGIDLIYLSQLRPRTLRTTPKTYYVGIEDTSDENSPNAGAFLEVQCAKGITVKK